MTFGPLEYEVDRYFKLKESILNQMNNPTDARLELQVKGTKLNILATGLSPENMNMLLSTTAKDIASRASNGEYVSGTKVLIEVTVL